MEAAREWVDHPVVQPLGDGHIHGTFLLEGVREDQAQTLVLQRFNEYVFQDPELVLSQTKRILARWRDQKVYQVPQIIPSRTGLELVRQDGEVWRCWSYLAGLKTVDPISSPGQAEAAGAAFGMLQNALMTMPGPPLVETIEGFLRLSYYLDRYAECATHAPADMHARIERHAQLASEFTNSDAKGDVHIHGDCKVNNLLFTPDGQTVAAVIDFDTAMSGHRAWDLGDLLRSLCFSLGRVDEDLYIACVRGFQRWIPDLTLAEAVDSSRYVALMLGVRFLTDHLQGDPYFAVLRRGENLERAAEQFQLLDALDAAKPKLREKLKGVLSLS